ncbi:hypothetical protein LINPERPRIM_LOCUS30159 [Linum perenne]
MHFSGRCAKYVSEEAVEVTFDMDFLCYFQRKKVGTKELKYDSVERMWLVSLGKTLACGLVQVCNDENAEKISDVGKDEVVQVYMEGTNIESFYGDNEELESEWHHGLSGSDPEVEVSAVATNVADCPFDRRF